MNKIPLLRVFLTSITSLFELLNKPTATSPSAEILAIRNVFANSLSLQKPFLLESSYRYFSFNDFLNNPIIFLKNHLGNVTHNPISVDE